VSDIVNKTWSALDGRLVFAITFDRAWSRDDAGAPAYAEVTCLYEPTETRVIALRRDRPTDFRLRFGSGCTVEGVLQELGHIVVAGADSLGVFGDLRFCAPRSAEHYFEGLMATCPAGGHDPSPYSPGPSSGHAPSSEQRG
jgi:hypothetical protein